MFFTIFEIQKLNIPHLVHEHPGHEGEREGGPDGEGAHQRALEGGVLVPRLLQTLLQVAEEDAEAVDDAEHDPVHQEGAEHHQPGLDKVFTCVRYNN